MRRTDGKWITETPADLLRWLWNWDGTEAVVIDDAAKTYYCATEDTAAKFRDAWAKERRKGDKRTAAMFIDLAPILHASEPMPSPAPCGFTGKYCSETCAETCEISL